MARATALFRDNLSSRRLARAAADRLIPDPAGAGLRNADLVIEAINEDSAAKQRLFQDLEPELKPGALLASNSSSIPLQILSKRMQHPDRLLGLHFFNPVSRMQLVEVVTSDETPSERLTRAAAFVHAIDRLPLRVSSSPGFLFNRVLMPYLLEAVQMVQEGINPEQIDRAARKFGMPMGPIELADRVGLDICLAVTEKMVDYLKEGVPQLLRYKVEQGIVGMTSDRGFYHYPRPQGGRLRLRGKTRDAGPLAERMILRLLNEAVACLREKVVADADLLNAGIVFGTGFAPFRGGPCAT